MILCFDKVTTPIIHHYTSKANTGVIRNRSFCFTTLITTIINNFKIYKMLKGFVEIFFSNAVFWILE